MFPHPVQVLDIPGESGWLSPAIKPFVYGNKNLYSCLVLKTIGSYNQGLSPNGG